MQFEDPRSILEAAAAKPSRGVDAAALTRRGRRMRRARFAGVAAGLALTLVGASASMGMLDGREGPHPAGDGAACDPGSSTVSIYLRPGATDADVERIRAEVAADRGVVSVEYVSEQETAAMLRELSAEWGESRLDSVPKQLRAVVADDAAADRLSDMQGGAILGAFAGIPDYKCLAQEVCDGPAPLTAAVYLEDGAPEEEVDDLRVDLESRPGIADVRYVSKERAYAQFRRLYPNRPDLYDSIGPQDLPASLRVTATQADALDEVRYLLSPVVDEVRISGDFAARICGDEAPPSTLPSPPADDDSGPTESPEPVPDVQPDLIGAECGAGPLRVSATQLVDSPGAKWCRFELVVFNAGARPAVFDYDEAALHTATTPVAPWLPDGELPETAGSLFAEPVGPEETARGELIYVIEQGGIPTKLELWERLRNVPLVFLLHYESCPADLHDDPDLRCAFEATLREPPPYEAESRIEVRLDRCGVRPVVFMGLEWAVPAPPFDETSAPAGFAGEGRITRTSQSEALYVDESGARITFRSLEGWHPPPCD